MMAVASSRIPAPVLAAPRATGNSRVRKAHAGRRQGELPAMAPVTRHGNCAEMIGLA